MKLSLFDIVRGELRPACPVPFTPSARTMSREICPSSARRADALLVAASTDRGLSQCEDWARAKVSSGGFSGAATESSVATSGMVTEMAIASSLAGSCALRGGGGGGGGGAGAAALPRGGGGGGDGVDAAALPRGGGGGGAGVGASALPGASPRFFRAGGGGGNGGLATGASAHSPTAWLEDAREANGEGAACAVWRSSGCAGGNRALAHSCAATGDSRLDSGWRLDSGTTLGLFFTFRMQRSPLSSPPPSCLNASPNVACHGFLSIVFFQTSGRWSRSLAPVRLRRMGCVLFLQKKHYHSSRLCPPLNSRSWGRSGGLDR